MSAATRAQARILTGPAERQRVLEILRTGLGRLRARGIARLSLYGSVARGEAGPSSDVDLLVELAPQAAPSLLDLLEVRHQLEEIIGRRVEIAEPSGMRTWLREWIEPERIEVL